VCEFTSRATGRIDLVVVCVVEYLPLRNEFGPIAIFALSAAALAILHFLSESTSTREFHPSYVAHLRAFRRNGTVSTIRKRARINMLEHVLIGKVRTLCRNMLQANARCRPSCPC
jgi:hypothetical protein